VRLLYPTQTATAPPEVTVFASAPEQVPEAYTRYLRTRFSEAFGLVGVPLRVRLRPRREATGLTTPRGSGARARRH
jgi:GTPase